MSDSHFQLEGSLFLVDDARLPGRRNLVMLVVALVPGGDSTQLNGRVSQWDDGCFPAVGFYAFSIAVVFGAVFGKCTQPHPGDPLPWPRSSPRRTRPRWLGSIASFLKLRKPPPGARSSTCRSQTRTSRFPCWKPGRSLCRNRMLGGPIQPRFTSHAATIADAALIASLTSWRVAVG